MALYGLEEGPSQASARHLPPGQKAAKRKGPHGRRALWGVGVDQGPEVQGPAQPPASVCFPSLGKGESLAQDWGAEVVVDDGGEGSCRL